MVSKCSLLLASLTSFNLSHRSYDCVGAQVIELDYSEADQDSTGEEAANTEKQLVYYQLDLGLNHVTRLWSDPISR